MGKANWLAVQGVAKAHLLGALGWRECGFASDEINSRFACLELPEGWVVLTSSEAELDLKGLLPRASEMGLALGCDSSEIVMSSRLRAWSQGRQAWSVSHNPSRDRFGVAVRGRPPPQLEAIRAEHAAKQALERDVDHMFDVPMQLAKSLCGYELGQMIGQDWSVLCRADDRRGRPRTSNLRDELCSSIVPHLQTLGWRPRTSGKPGGFFDVERLRDGRLQELWLTWKDDSREIYCLPGFLVRRGETRDDEILLSGDLPSLRSRSTFRSRLAEFLGHQPEADAAKRLRNVVAELRDQIAALHRFLDYGAAEPFVRVQRGSLEGWRQLRG